MYIEIGPDLLTQSRECRLLHLKSLEIFEHHLSLKLRCKIKMLSCMIIMSRTAQWILQIQTDSSSEL